MKIRNEPLLNRSNDALLQYSFLFCKELLVKCFKNSFFGFNYIEVIVLKAIEIEIIVIEIIVLKAMLL